MRSLKRKGENSITNIIYCIILLYIILLLSCSICGVYTVDINNFPDRVDYVKELNGSLIYPKILEIGDWNMDIQQFGTVTHGLGSNYKKIRSIDIIIRNDDDDLYSTLKCSPNAGEYPVEGGAIWEISPLYIVMERYTGGKFDNVGYDSTSYNRGWVTIWFED